MRKVRRKDIFLLFTWSVSCGLQYCVACSINTGIVAWDDLKELVINPRRMHREGYCSCRVCLSVCLLFDNSLHEWLFASKTNTHIQRRMEVKKYVGFSLKLLRSRVMASFTHLE